MNVAQPTLQEFQGRAPAGALRRQETLEGIAKALQSDTQPVIAHATGIAAAPAIQLRRFVQEPQGDGGEVWVMEWQVLGALGQFASPLLPALACKILQGGAGLVASAALVPSEPVHKGGGAGLLIEMQAAHPHRHHLDVAQFRQTLLESFARLPQVPPAGVRIEFGKTFRQRAGAAQGNAQIVDRFGSELAPGQIALIQDAAQGMGQSVGGKGNRGRADRAVVGHRWCGRNLPSV